ncbi:hypothetical protein RKD23_003620 [Streptomyces sp. SAI-170]
MVPSAEDRPTPGCKEQRGPEETSRRREDDLLREEDLHDEGL